MPGAPTANADSASTSSASDARAEPAAGDKRGYTDDVYAQLVDAFGRADGVSSSGSTGGMMFAGPGAPSSDFQLPTVFVTPDSAKLHPQFVTPEGASTGLAYGPGYNGALSGLTVAPAGFGNDVDLNAAAFRVPTTGTGKSSWDALTQQADARIADGTYDRFSDMGHAITDPGSFGDRLKRLAHAATYTRPDADEQTAAALSPPPMSTGDAAIDSMRSSPFAGMAGGIAYELGGTDTDALYASQAAGSLGGVAASVAGYQLPKALQAESRASVSRSNAKVRVAPVDVGTLEEPAGSADNARQTNPPKAESPIWRGFKNAKNGVKTDGTRLFQWDHDHDDIEVYNKRLVHMGSMDPVTGLIYKPPVPGRRLKNW
ncbi:Cytotoxic [Caballeronia temeraria]|uniref:Cytotoxic n=2 Tax=Caballeronia temeraria TaxID=1777137 RepID=A0A158E0I3_9BURK|nr:Cytotoxic [Caballeronia temeraria]